MRKSIYFLTLYSMFFIIVGMRLFDISSRSQSVVFAQSHCITTEPITPTCSGAGCQGSYSSAESSGEGGTQQLNSVTKDCTDSEEYVCGSYPALEASSDPTCCVSPNTYPFKQCVGGNCITVTACGQSSCENNNDCGVGGGCVPGTYNPHYECVWDWICTKVWECGPDDCYDWYDCWPLESLVDLGGNGIEMTNVTNGVYFDLNSDGIPDRISWTTPNTDDAWLALDRNGNGKIDDGTELFGNYSPQPKDKQTRRNGFRALTEYDKPQNGGNNDGKISDQDIAFSLLCLWQDTNQNGLTDQGELQTLSKFGIVSINLNNRRVERDKGISSTSSRW